MDKWSRFNEAAQNLIALSIVAVYLYMVVTEKEAPLEMIGFVTAVLVFFGFKVVKAKNGNGQ